MSGPMIVSWCAGSPCDPCPPKPQPGQPPTPPSGSLPPFTSAYITINEIQITTDLHGNTIRHAIGSMIIWTTGGGTNQGQFGTPLSFGPAETSSIASSVVVYDSFITIAFPYYPSGSYNDSLPETTTGPLTPTTSATDGSTLSNQNASILAGNAAITQANQVLGNTPKPTPTP